MSRLLSVLLFFCLSYTTLANESNSLDNILNFYQITENIGLAGQPLADQFADIAGAGYSTIINLAMPDSTNALAEEGDIVTSLGMHYIHIPVPWDAPSITYLKKFFESMDALGNEKVFVHCAANYRASAFTYQYLTLRKGLSAEAATSPILQMWWPDMDDKWRSIIELDAHDF